MLKLTQQQKLLQKLSPAQIQLMKLLQLPITALEQRIKEEIEINPALEDTADEEPIRDENENESDESDDLNEEEKKKLRMRMMKKAAKEDFFTRRLF
jgi:RNA polymerase sigma-54 factor